MTLPSRHTLQKRLLARGQEYEVHQHPGVVVGRYAHDVAVFAFEGGAGDDYAGGGGSGGGGGGGERRQRGGAEEGEPVPAVGVGEGVAVGHFGDVFGGVVLGGSVSGCGWIWGGGGKAHVVAFEVGEVEGRGEVRSNG